MREAGGGVNNIKNRLFSGDAACPPPLLPLLELPVEELRDLFDDLLPGGFDFGKAVVAALDNVQSRGHAGLLERGVEQFALVERHGEIPVAVNDEEWRVALADIGDGIGLPAFVGDFLDRRAQQAGRG